MVVKFEWESPKKKNGSNKLTQRELKKYKLAEKEYEEKLNKWLKTYEIPPEAGHGVNAEHQEGDGG